MRKLLEKEVDWEALNAIILEQVAKDEMEVNLKTVDFGVTDEMGTVTEFSLDRLFGGEQGVNIPNVGRVLAAGELATLVARTASNQDVTDGGLENVLEDFDVSRPLAKTYLEGIKSGSVLLFLRVEDEQATEATAVLHANQGSYLSGT